MTEQERILVDWLLRHGKPDAHQFLEQLNHATVVAHCPCGCASIDFAINGIKTPPSGVHILSDFVFGDGETLNGVFVFSTAGHLAGLEVYGGTGDAPTTLPSPDELRPFE